MKIKECTCCGKHWLLYGSVEPLNCTPETDIALHVNQLEFNKNLKLKKKNLTQVIFTAPFKLYTVYPSMYLLHIFLN